MAQPDHNDTHTVDGITENRANRPPIYFNVLYFGLIVWGVIFAAYYLFSGWSSEAEFKENKAAFDRAHSKTAPAAVAAAAPAVDGQEVYGKNCAGCHGATGKGGIGPDLTAATYRQGRDLATVAATISDGRSGGMPGFANQLNQGQIKAVAEYILTLK